MTPPADPDDDDKEGGEDQGDGDPTGRVQSERISALAALFGAGGPPDFDDLSAPLYWPSMAGDEATKEWADLRTWIEELVERFPHLDHHVIPLCWWRHPGHVEALQALRDHERVSYSETASATAAVDWHRAFADIEARLREWTGQLSCGARHEQLPTRLRTIDNNQWEQFVAEDSARRDVAAATHAIEGE